VPFFGMASPILIALTPDHPIASQMLIPSLICLLLCIVVVLACCGKIHVALGHVALFFFNGLSLLCFLALA
jgi:hypothetical protein